MTRIIATLALVVVLLGPVPGSSENSHVTVAVGFDGDRFVIRSVLPTARTAPLPDPGDSFTYQAIDERGTILSSGVFADPRLVNFDARSDQGIQFGGPMSLDHGASAIAVPASARVIRLQSSGAAPVVTRLPIPAPIAMARASKSTTLVDNGPVGKRVDVVFVGDGYTKSRLSTYRADVNAMTAAFLTEPPFSDYASFFNIHRVDVVSRQNGVDHYCDGVYRDTALDVGYVTTGIDCRRLVSMSPEKVLYHANSAPDADVVVVVANSSIYGGSGSPLFAVTYNGEVSNDVMLHELGHTFGQLADEYEFEGVYRGPEPREKNVTSATLRGKIKWREWIAPTTPVPTSEDLTVEDLPGLFEGASQYGTRIYRPTFSSKMRESAHPFERVNYSLLVQRIFRILPDKSPAIIRATATGATSPTGGGAAVVRLTASDPQSYVMAYAVSAYPNFRDTALVLASNAPTFQLDTVVPIPREAPGKVYVRIVNGAGMRRTVALSPGVV